MRDRPEALGVRSSPVSLKNSFCRLLHFCFLHKFEELFLFQGVDCILWTPAGVKLGFLQVQTAEVLLAVMTQGAIALLMSVPADEALVLPGPPGRAAWLHTQLLLPHLLTPPSGFGSRLFVFAFL